MPQLEQGKRMIISAHGNSLRALIKYLDGISDEAVVQLNIPTGIPLVYEIDADLAAAQHYYLAEDDALHKAVSEVANQSAVK